MSSLKSRFVLFVCKCGRNQVDVLRVHYPFFLANVGGMIYNYIVCKTGIHI